MSIKIQKGAESIIVATISPIGFMRIASIKWPFASEIIERVEPQEGQGIFVIISSVNSIETVHQNQKLLINNISML